MPDDSPAAFEEGRSLFDNRHYDRAIDKFRQTLLEDPARSDAHNYLGRSLLEKQLKDEAAGEFCEAIRKNPSDADSRYRLALILMEKKSNTDATTLFLEALRQEPGLLHRFCDPMVSLIQRQYTFAEAEEFLKNCIAIIGAAPLPAGRDTDTARSLADLLSGLGQLYYAKGLLNGAMLQFREAVRICPKESRFHARLADIYFITNNDDEAVAEYRIALAHDPGNAEVHKRLGDALVKTRQFMDAFNEYREAVRILPENEYYRNVYSRFRTLFIDSGDEGTKEGAVPRYPAHAGGGVIAADETFRTLVSGGENEFVEFKSSALWSKNLTKSDISTSDSRDVHKYGRDTSKVIIAKTIAGFLNTEGGNLIIGIRENKTGGTSEIIGIENEYAKLKDPCPDGYRRMIIDEIIRKFLPPEIFHHLNKYIRIHFLNVNDHTLCRLEIKKADDGVFVRVQDDESFFIRIDAETRQLTDKGLVDYCRKRFV